MVRKLFLPLLLLLMLALAVPGALAQETKCFSETSQCISGRFLEYWEQNGGLAAFGYPITAAQNERNNDTGQTYLTQWFQRNRFEMHPENGRPYDVLLGRLGNDRLLQQGRDWFSFPKANPGQPHYYAPTGHAVAEVFWNYWSGQGLDLGDAGVSERESLALWGMPLSEPAMETNASGDTVLTQWFERARFEHHPNNQPPYNILLGLLGSEVRGTAPPPPPATPNPTAPPAATPTPAPLPPSFNGCQADPNAGQAPNYPVDIVTINKSSETVTLRNTSSSTVNLSGWRMCSITGNQEHTGISGTLEPGQERSFTYGGSIWNNSSKDDGALYDSQGRLVSYWSDPT